MLFVQEGVYFEGEDNNRYQNGIINEGGQNKTPRNWDNETGLNNNPVKRRKKIKSINLNYFV